MYASSLEKYNECLEAFEQYKTVQNYENFYHHIESEYLNRPEKWALHARASMPTHGNHTNNYVESHFKIIKENVMHRHKCYNLPDFLDLMMKESSEYYRRICLSNGRFNPRQSKYKIPEKLSISREKVTKISDSIFMVESEKNSDQIYSVDMQSGVCSCMKGVTKAPCKHKFACAKFFQVSQFYALPDQDIDIKQMY